MIILLGLQFIEQYRFNPITEQSFEVLNLLNLFVTQKKLFFA